MRPSVDAATRRRGNPEAKPYSDAEVNRLERALTGILVRPGDPSYDEARTIWNAMVDRRPDLIARCMSTADVVAAVDFARRNGLAPAIRGGGHNIAGHAVCDGGLMIDLSPMRTVLVDSVARTARVGPGATLGDLDQATQAHGLAVPLGINSTTGISGLTLGGGFGWLSRSLGLTVDSLLGAEVVLASGETVRASEEENPDLFWAIRGGGGNFGVVTEFRFRLHPVGPNVFAGLIAFPLAQGREVLRSYRDLVTGLGEDAVVWAVTRPAPPLPFLPAEAHGKPMVALAAFHLGGEEAGGRLAASLRRFGTPYGEHFGMQPYLAWQQVFDPLLTPGARNYWKSHSYRRLTDRTIDAVTDLAGRLPSPHTEIFVGLLGGKINRIPAEATAYWQRDAVFVMNVHGRWTTADEDEACMAWTREAYRDTAADATGGVYVNFLTEEEGDRIRSAYGPNYDRLVELKRRFDPENLFRLNQNLDPKGAAAG